MRSARLAGLALLWAAMWLLSGVRDASAAGYSVSSCGGVAACSGNFCYCCDSEGVYNGGNCVWYTWNRRCQAGEKLTWCTDAHKWAADAKSRGWPVCSVPKVGAIGVYSGQHVGYVDAIEGDYVWTREQACWGFSGVKYIKRHKSYWDLGYIYFKNDSCAPTTGNLKVTIEPSGARSAGAQWRRTGTSTWRNSGYTETGLSTGSKTVEFKTISNWDKPANASITVNAGQTASMTKTYVRHKGSLKVTINPSDARTAGAKWRRTGTSTWRDSGATESNIDTGTYTVEFNTLASPWIKPSNISVSITKNNTTSATARYNRPPVLASPGSHFVHVGALLTFPVTATDADGDAITLSMASAPSGATLVSTGGVGTLRYTPTLAQSGGTFTPSFTATDALNAKDTKSGTIQVGSPPTIDPIAPQRARVGQLYELDVQADDPNGDVITLTMGNAPSGAVFDPGDGRHGVFTFTPESSQGGEVHDIVFTASDADGQHSVTVTLIIGAPPVLQPVDDVALTAGQIASFTVTAADPNNDAKTFTMTGAPETATLTGSGDSRTFSYTALESEKGIAFDITFQVSEIDGEDSATMRLRVQGPPEFVEIPPQRVVITNELELAVEAVDPDGDAMTFSMTDAPPSAVFETHASGGTFRYTPSAEEGAQTYTVTFTASAIDGVTGMEVPVLVGVPPLMTAPVTQQVAKFNLLEFEVSASDLNDDELVLSVASLPENAEFEVDGPVGVFRFTPSSFQGDQDYAVVFRVEDGLDGYDERTVDIRVLDDDMYEQNDLMEEATDFNPYRGMTRPAKQSDDDWYYIDLPFGRQRVSVDVQFDRELGDMQTVLYNAQGVVVGYGVTMASGLELHADSPYFGRHYLVIFGENVGNGYALLWDHADSWDGCVGADDAYAPNHTRDTAVVLTSGEWLTDGLGVGIAGPADWYVIDVPGGEEWLSVTSIYGQVEHPLRLEVYDPDGELIASVDGADGRVEWSGALVSRGAHAVKIESVNDPVCIPYDLIVHTAPRENLPVEYLSGRYVRLPVSVSDQPGRWLAPDPSEGGRYNAAGAGGRTGPDFWGNVPALANQVIGLGGSVRTNGLDWHQAPMITRLSAGSWNRLSIEGEPFEGLYFQRVVEFEEGDRVVVVRDQLLNLTDESLESLLTMDSVNPTPDYAQADLRTANDVRTVFDRPDLVTASSLLSGRTVALGSSHPAAVPDASFLSRVNPYTVLASPNDPDGAAANLSVKLILNHDQLGANESTEVLWYLVFGSDADDAADQFEIAVMRNEWDDDAFEPNDELVGAVDVSGQSGARLRAIQANDDWYAIELPIGVQDVNVEARFARAHGDVQIDLYSADGDWLCGSELTDEGATLSCVAAAHGIVYLRVWGDDSGNVYDLVWTAGSSWGGCAGSVDDGFEPNNSRDEAGLLAPGVWGALQSGGMLVAGDDDWYALELTPDQVALTVTSAHHAAHGDLALELYDWTGTLLHAVDTASDYEVLAFTVPREGRYYLRVVPPASGATCNPYDLIWSGEPSADPASDAIHLYGRYLYLPIQRTGEPGRMVLSDQSAGLRYDASGVDGFGGVDIWRYLTIPCAHYIGWDGSQVVTNGKGWASGPVVEKLSAGDLNHARISGTPKDGLLFVRDVRFMDGDRVILIEDVLVNEGVDPLDQVLTMDTFHPNPDYDEGILNTRNYVTALYRDFELAVAEATLSGITLAVGSESPYAVVDASFLSRQNPYTVLNAPNHPSGQEANFSLKMLMNYGAVPPGAAVTGRWEIVVGVSRAEAITLWRELGADQPAMMDMQGSSLPDWWEIAYFGGSVDPDADEDGDGMSNLREYLAGTDPHDPESVFRVDFSVPVFDPLIPGGPVLHFEIQPGRRGTLLYGTNLFGPFWPFPDAPSGPGRHSVTDHWDRIEGTMYYLLRLDEPQQ